MFSGIIEAQGEIIAKQWGTFVIRHSFGNDLSLWQSIAHDGACMTLTAYDEETYTFFAMGESFSKTNFTNKRIGEYMNIERCVRIWDRIDGHIVSWHIDTTWIVSNVQGHNDGSCMLCVQFDPLWDKYVIEKGSVTINGVSLTITDVSSWSLCVWIIPHTQEITNLWVLTKDSVVNLEFDMLGKYIWKQNNL